MRGPHAAVWTPSSRTASSCTGDEDWGPSPVPLSPGEVLAPGYPVVGHLRRGRRLDVYDVWSTARTCRCVAKTLRPERRHDTTADEQLRLEGELLARLTHPHLVRAYETVETLEHCRPAVIVETLPGHTLARLIGDHGRLRPPDAAVLGVQLCSAVGYLHHHGWLHLDVKPANVVATGGRAVLLDLSLAARPGTRSSGGTLDYLAPEQARGDVVTEATDVWALGVTLYECLAGVTPFDEYLSGSAGAAGADRLFPQREHRAPPLRRHGRFGRALDGLVHACLEPRPEDRPCVVAVAEGLAHAAGVDPRRC